VLERWFLFCFFTAISTASPSFPLKEPTFTDPIIRSRIMYNVLNFHIIFRVHDLKIQQLNSCKIFFLGQDSEVTLSQILDFWTGADAVPPLGFEKKLTIDFYVLDPWQRLPTSSTCSTTLFFTKRGQRRWQVDIDVTYGDTRIAWFRFHLILNWV